MRVEAETDVTALRRISLLARRAKEDSGSCCGDLDGIVQLIDRMKRNIAVGSEPLGSDLRQMVSLVGRLSCGRNHGDRLHDAMMTELRDLVSQITP